MADQTTERKLPGASRYYLKTGNRYIAVIDRTTGMVVESVGGKDAVRVARELCRELNEQAER